MLSAGKPNVGISELMTAESKMSTAYDDRMCNVSTPQRQRQQQPCRHGNARLASSLKDAASASLSATRATCWRRMHGGRGSSGDRLTNERATSPPRAARRADTSLTSSLTSSISRVTRRHHRSDAHDDADMKVKYRRVVRSFNRRAHNQRKQSHCCSMHHICRSA